MLRYFEGKDAAGNVVWPPVPTASDVTLPPLPGPTLRARVGDRVELTFLNHVRVDEFGGTLDRVESGAVEGCDRVTSSSGQAVYPGMAGDRGPNCFHGSSTANVHFHGTHVTPDGLGDNILLQLRPNPQVTEASVREDFARIFRAGPPERWSELPLTWRVRQLQLLREHDDKTVWQGQRGTPGHPALPPANRLLPHTEALIRAGLWPQYQIGAYPFCFDITKFVAGEPGHPPRFAMGQSPGTHWYHAHKHGSTAINVYNGMAGVFVIEGDYDDSLRKLYPHLTERVFIVQNFSDAPNLTRIDSANAARRFAPSLWINGLANPTISIRPGEIQLWRFVNASVRAVLTLLDFVATAGTPTGGGAPEMRQIAQDGVQFRFENYRDQPRRAGAPTDAARANTFAPGNRFDVLVKAPLQTGSWTFDVNDTTINRRTSVLTLKVEGANSAMDFPADEASYPSFPPFLSDIRADEIQISRTLDFGWERGRGGAGRGSGGGPQFTIDSQQFKGDRYDQTMVLGDCEEWTLTNSTSGIAHPFHIHVNPFQVVEIHDPVSGTTYKPTGNFVWQDVVAIPPSKLDSNGNVVGEKGFVRIRHRFADFAGSFVLHCHMLAHEDRGMMQLVRVIPSEAIIRHR
jgi:FtsP/CotA-like multicopper oxidase with cupredoxin domain